MRRELADREWNIIQAMPPDKPRGGLTSKIHAVVDRTVRQHGLTLRPAKRTTIGCVQLFRPD